MAERAWYRSLYWRITIGFVCFLAATLVVQASLFVWLIVWVERDVPANALGVFASTVANDVASEVQSHGVSGLERYLSDRYGSLPRQIWVVMEDGSVIAGRWGPLPANLLRRLRFFRRVGATPPPVSGQDVADPWRLRRVVAFAPVVVRGQTIGTVVVQAGRPSDLVAREFGPILLVIALGLVVGVGGLAALLIFRPANRRLQALADAARRLGAGDTTARAPESGGDEIAGVARAFNQMAADLLQRAEALQASDRVRRQLLADVSHELMTPLTAIRGYLETLEMPAAAPDAASRGRYLAIVGEETLRLEQIVGDLLDLARLEAGGGTLNIEEVPVSQNLLAGVGPPRARGHGIRRRARDPRRPGAARAR